MLDRFQYDNGSALSRDYALQILEQSSASALWFGLPLAELAAIQQSYGLTAIEISWVNFIMVDGLIATIPLFITYCFFLFRSTRLYCDFGIYFVSLLILVSTSANNGIWSKTTVLTIQSYRRNFLFCGATFDDEIRSCPRFFGRTALSKHARGLRDDRADCGQPARGSLYASRSYQTRRY